MVFERRCVSCTTVGTSPCACCIARLRPCPEASVEGLDRCLVVVEYDDMSRAIIGALKYRGVRSVAQWLGTAMAERVVRAGEQPDVVTWVPATQRNRRRRGFDQGQLLASVVARRLSIPTTAVARRSRGPSQTGRSREQRLAGPQLRRRGHCIDKQRCVLIVDDVLTTGASLGAVGALLEAQERCVAVVAARRQ